ncbi:MAG: Lrp/AsnC family transcriptional regulator [Syntrophomonadaceae bacterium]|jgi:DNA-binding Lrp family transcriptional regulator
MNQFTPIEKELLDLLQNRFPLIATPYQELAEELGLSEEEVIEKVQALRQQGVIRRIGAILDAGKMGYYSTLCACQVPTEHLEAVAAIINALPGVTHNYQRQHRYNLWFTLSAPSSEAVVRELRQLEQQTGVKIVSMPATRNYKIDARFKMGDDYD